MKTRKIILVTALIALGAILYGQADQVQFITAEYKVKNSRFENLVSGFMSKAEKLFKKEYDEPIVYMTYNYDHADVVYEEAFSIESWMTSPFESSMAEDELSIESWMTSPFGADENIEIESWMTDTF